MGKTKNILKGKFPNKPMTLDEQVQRVNKANAHILESFTNGDQDKVDRQVNNLALWLGGLHPDIQVYAFQVLLKGYKIGFDADDKTEARMARLEERIENSTGYIQYHYKDLVHYAWPVEYLDGTTFEDRLEGLVEEYGLERTPVDMLLSGVEQPSEDLDVAQRLQLAEDAVEDLAATYQKGGIAKPNPVLVDRLDRFLGWCLTIEPEIVIFTVSKLMKQHKVMFNPEGMKHWDTFKAQYGPMVMIG